MFDDAWINGTKISSWNAGCDAYPNSPGWNSFANPTGAVNQRLDNERRIGL